MDGDSGNARIKSIVKLVVKPILIVLVALLALPALHAQKKLKIGGRFQSQVLFFIPDSTIGAWRTPQYDKRQVGTDNWLELDLSYKGFELSTRYDVFVNSNLLDPNRSYTKHGLGMARLTKSYKSSTFSLGHQYEQIGNGLLFRSFENRALLWDNALIGASVKTNINNIAIKGFTGTQKNLFDIRDSWISGLDLSYDYMPKNADWQGKLGIGIFHKYWGDESFTRLEEELLFYLENDKFIPSRHALGASLYYQFSKGDFTWHGEVASKWKDTYFDPEAPLSTRSGATINGKVKPDLGLAFYQSLGYNKRKWGLNLELRRVQDFLSRAYPLDPGFRNQLNYLPSFSRLYSYPLKNRYLPVTQFLDENAIQLNAYLKPSKRWTIEPYLDVIWQDDRTTLFREFDLLFRYKSKKRNVLKFGIQSKAYNEGVYEQKGDMVHTISPYIDYLYRIGRKKTIRGEAALLFSEQDYGSWVYGLVEYTLAPHWSFSIADMYNFDPLKTGKLHYPRIDVFYRRNALNLGLSYIKQVGGVVCAGGVCRLEPAFSGVKITYNQSF